MVRRLSAVERVLWRAVDSLDRRYEDSCSKAWEKADGEWIVLTRYQRTLRFLIHRLCHYLENVSQQEWIKKQLAEDRHVLEAHNNH